METLRITLPASWQELTDEQMTKFYSVICSLHLSTIEDVLFIMFFVWGGISPSMDSDKDILVVRHQGKKYRILKDHLVQMVETLSYLKELPDFPVRISTLHKHAALSATLDNASLEDYMVCDNLYQGYIETKDNALLQLIAEQLYRCKVRFSDGELTSVFYWWAGLKNFLAKKYTYIFKSAAASTDLMGFAPMTTIEDSMNSMIRALTKGDITKESQVLAQPLHRALTELNELSREYEDMKNKTNQ